MQPPSVPANEADRLVALQALHILDTAPEERFDRLTRLARRLFNAPIAQLNLVDSTRVWSKSGQGLVADRDIPRDISFCAHTINHPDTLIVEDASQDPRFQDSPLLADPPGLRFYAGHPLALEDGSRIGTLCIFDRQARPFSNEDQALLQDLARMAEQEIAILATTTTDPLTGISNRRGFMTLASHALDLCARCGEAASLVMFDLDTPKAKDDRSGHSTGDPARIAFATLMSSVFRDSDVFARTGANEFVALLTADDHYDVERTLERFGQAVHTYNQQAPSGETLQYNEVHITHPASSDESLMELLVRADDLMAGRRGS